MKNIFSNHVEGKKWLRYFMAALLVFALALTGCGVTQGTVEDGDKTANETTNSGSEWNQTLADETAGGASQDTPDGSIEESDDRATDEESEATPEETLEEYMDETGETFEAEDAELAEDGTYTSKDDVARYIYIYGHLPSNFITKKEANNLGWQGGSLEPYAPGKCIGGSRFGNYEGLLPERDGRVYTECDIDTLGADKRGARRIVFSNDGLIYYTGDHYESFELLYGDD